MLEVRKEAWPTVKVRLILPDAKSVPKHRCWWGGEPCFGKSNNACEGQPFKLILLCDLQKTPVDDTTEAHRTPVDCSIAGDGVNYSQC